MTHNRCPKCGAFLHTATIDVNGVVIRYCTTILTSLGVNGVHGDFSECGYRSEGI